jgi:hypothetical protein
VGKAEADPVLDISDLCAFALSECEPVSGFKS